MGFVACDFGSRRVSVVVRIGACSRVSLVHWRRMVIRTMFIRTYDVDDVDFMTRKWLATCQSGAFCRPRTAVCK